jgi:hypothetical protein
MIGTVEIFILYNTSPTDIESPEQPTQEPPHPLTADTESADRVILGDPTARRLCARTKGPSKRNDDRLVLQPPAFHFSLVAPSRLRLLWTCMPVRDLPLAPADRGERAPRVRGSHPKQGAGLTKLSPLPSPSRGSGPSGDGN